MRPKNRRCQNLSWTNATRSPEAKKGILKGIKERSIKRDVTLFFIPNSKNIINGYVMSIVRAPPLFQSITYARILTLMQEFCARLVKDH